jgi:hypothetical protein
LEFVDVMLPKMSSEGSTRVVPVTNAQWRRSVRDADVSASAAVYSKRRRRVVSARCAVGPELGRSLRPAIAEFASAASDLCCRLEALAAFDIENGGPRTAEMWRDRASKDARAVVDAVIDERQPSPESRWPTLPVVGAAEDHDPLFAIFGITADELTDDAGSFCDTRVLAYYRFRLRELQNACDPILGLVADRPPSVFTAVSAVRDLATSASPFLTLHFARDIRARILNAFATDSTRTVSILADASTEMGREWSSFGRLQASVARASAAHTERERAVSVLEAYRHFSEGLTRRWVWTLLRLSGLDGPMPTVGGLVEPGVARLGELGAQIRSALVPAMRNADAHEDVEFDDDSGLLVAGDTSFDPDAVLERLTDLDVLQRALVIGRLAAFADQPALAGSGSESNFGSSGSSALLFARQRFGHAGQRVRSFVRDRDRLDILIDSLRPETCNPCFMALTQSARVLPNVSRFLVRLPEREDPVIDLPAPVLKANWQVFELAARLFPDALPQVTFLPCITWLRLSRESNDEAARAAAWMAFNDAQHAILDAEAEPKELIRLPARLAVVDAAAAATVMLMPPGPHLSALVRARRMSLALARAVSDADAGTVGTDVLMDGIARARDRLGPAPAILPALDPRPPRASSYPHTVS